MKSKFRRVALIGKYQTASAAALLTESHKVLQDIALFLQKQHCEVVLESETATNTGMTAIINPHGQIIALLPANTAQVLHGEIEGRQGETPYMRLGSSRPLMLLLAGVLLGIFVWARRRRV